MRRRAAAGGLVLAVTVAVALLGAGPAAGATELRLSPASGPPGAEFVISGTGFASAQVELRWGSLSGPVIARAVGPAFSVSAVVPESPPNSHPVVAVVTDGTSVSTSSAAFQVTAGPPVDTTTTVEQTTTTVVEQTTTTVVEAPASRTTVPDVASGGTGRGTGVSGQGDRTLGVGGGLEPDTTSGVDGLSIPEAATTSAGAAATTAPATDARPTTNVPPAPAGVAEAGASPAVPTVQPGPATAPGAPEDDVADAALGGPLSSQSAGAVANPALLFLGLALVFGGGVFLAIRNRHRA